MSKKLKINLSAAGLTEMNVKDLKAIHARIEHMLDTAENILQRSGEVFPAAKSGWLRKIRLALGGLGPASKNYADTLDQTIEYCERLIGMDNRVAAHDVPSETEVSPEVKAQPRKKTRKTIKRPAE